MAEKQGNKDFVGWKNLIWRSVIKERSPDKRPDDLARHSLEEWKSELEGRLKQLDSASQSTNNI